MMNKVKAPGPGWMILSLLFALCLLASCKGGSDDQASLCDRVHAKGVILKVANAPTKEVWDKSCSTFPRELLECAAEATTAEAFQKCGETAVLDKGALASPELCGRVYARATELKVNPFPEQEEWLASCPALPVAALECAADSKTIEDFHRCGQAGTPYEGDLANKDLCERAYAKGMEFGLNETSSKEEWDIQCPRMPRVHVACATEAKSVEEFLSCGQ